MTAAAIVASLSNPLSLSQNPTTSPAPEKEVEYRERQGREQQEKEKGELKEAWRKSDSTIGHHTIRNPGTTGTRGSRPVSMAESFQSAYTIVPSGGGGPGSIGGNKRWSTLTGEMDFQVMMEEDGEDEEDSKAASSRAASGSGTQPPKAEDATRTSTSAKNINRRSMSLNVGISSSAKPQITPAYKGNRGLYCHRTVLHPILTRILGLILHPPASHQDQYRHQQQKMTLSPGRPSGKAPATHSLSTSPNYDPSRPPPSIATRGNHSSTAPVSFRQTAISMSNGFAKKAAEKIGGFGKKLGINTPSSGSGDSSSTSSREQPYSSSQSYLEQGGGVPLARTHSNQSSLASSMKSAASLKNGITTGIIHHVHLPGRNKSKEPEKKRRTPNAPSGAYSVASSITSTSTSESDLSTAPMLGKLVREPLRGRNGGVVFGRDLKTVVQRTRAIVALSDEQEPSNRQIGDREKMVKDMEHRVLPAVVVRCAQHILIWGIQEEGLFRVSGRASHVTKLRSEFDTGADYDLTDCTPGDLDPHAVASVFKAYLRELPEPLLTSGLQRQFEAALTQELATYPHQPSTTKITTRPTPGLPNSPKGNFNAGLRKPPSLSTLAMPSFQGMPAASGQLVQALKSLVARLPQENRDLARTVVDLIRATATASKETKMPLSNLLLVFCPSLNMSPPLLKALCENDGIWDPLPQEDEVIDIRRETIYLDISADKSLDVSDRDDDDYSDAREGLDPERQSIQSTSDYPCSGYNASAENSMLEEAPVRRKLIVHHHPCLPSKTMLNGYRAVTLLFLLLF
ncbi:hypothetical protein EST38_g782 [Candolleomyces aberdarensis]|uniref:Rho-GAP domain-containing protein n=1 Tax=Candolleomyces aberdarensis TaxID=2316362 RepID=A0A4Q2DXE0_9AGAR|nr:hypothetical protein EST38_g782 [Candolleomyces aberdarensis]